MRTLSLLALSLALLPATALADEPPLEAIVPKKTIAMISLPDIAKTRTALAGSSLGKLFAEPELKALMQAIGDGLAPQLKQLDEQLVAVTGLKLEQLRLVLRGELTVALIEVDQERGMPNVVVGLRYPEAHAKLLETMLTKLKGSADETSTSVHHGVTVTQLMLPSGPLCYTQTDGRLLVGLTPAPIASALGCLKAKEPTLAAHPQYTACAAAAGPVAEGGRELLRVYVDLAQCWAMAGPLPPAVGQLGLDSWKGLFISGRVQDGKLASVVHLHGGGEGGLAGLLGKPLAERSIKVPADAASWSHSRLDLAGQWKSLAALMKTSDPASHAQMMKAIEGFEAQHGFKLDRFLASVGDTVTTHARRPRFALAPSLLIRLPLRNKADFVAGARALAKAMELELAEAQYAGQTVMHLRQPLSPALGQMPFGPGQEPKPGAMLALFQMFMPMVMPHMLIEDGQVVIASTHQALVRHIDQRGSIAMREVALPEGALSASYLGSEQFVRIYATVLPNLAGVEGVLRAVGVPFDSRHLPSPDTLAKHLNDYRQTLARGAGGLTWKSEGPMLVSFDPSMTSIAGVGVLAAMILPVLSKVKEKANAANSKNNLKQLGLGLILYRDSMGRGTKFPPLETLLPSLYTSEIVVEPSLFACPSTGREVTEQDIKSNNRQAFGYDWTKHPIKSLKGASERPIAWTKADNFPGRRVVLFLDGHVEEVDEMSFQRLMKALDERAAQLKDLPSMHNAK